MIKSNGSSQVTDHLLMIRPVQFTFNEQTSVNNAFQSSQDADAQSLALTEFDDFVLLLRNNGIHVTVVDDTVDPVTPDSIFPNNWISFHDDGNIVLYPMYAENRRQERKSHVIDQVKSEFRIHRQIDLTAYESKDLFLEGTGSMVLDRVHRIAYACLSQRTAEQVIHDFCAKMNYRAELFHATDSKDFPIYHTNVMMCVADSYAVICLESIKDEKERKHVVTTLEHSLKEVIDISLDQMNHFAGNMLQVKNSSGQKFLIMSSQAYNILTPEQRLNIGFYNPILHSSLDTIERNGGGSARCMMAEIFLPRL